MRRSYSVVPVVLVAAAAAAVGVAVDVARPAVDAQACVHALVDCNGPTVDH